MNPCKKTRTFAGASCRKNRLECSTHAAPAHEPQGPPIKKKGDHGPSKIFANAASLFSFPISLLRLFFGVQLFLDDEDRCSGPMQNVCFVSFFYFLSSFLFFLSLPFFLLDTWYLVPGIWYSLVAVSYTHLTLPTTPYV